VEDLGVLAHARRRPDHPALVVAAGPDAGRARTYGALADRAGRLAGALRARGAEPGATVAVMLPNRLEHLEAGVATARARVHLLPVNWHLKADELAWVLADADARVLIADEALAEHVEPVRSRCPGCSVLFVGGGDSPYEEALATATPPDDDGWSSPTFIFYTSGTTGRPKGVVHAGLSAERMHAAQVGLAALWGLGADDVHLLGGPAYHAGPGGYAYTTLFVGGTVAVLPSFEAGPWLAAVGRHRVTTTFVTPAHLIRLLEVPEAERTAADLSSLRLVILAGAPCPVPVKRAAMDLLAPAALWELYGMSEGGATRVSPEEWLTRPGTVGRPWPGVEVRILDDDGNPLPPGRTGLIYVAPAGGARFRYHGDDAKTAAAWRDDAFTVGDVGHLDADGYLYVTDRAVDMVIRGGVNVYPREIEEVLHDHPTVVDCAVFGVPDRRLGEILKAVVEVREAVEPAELQAHCRARLADFKVPAVVELVDVLPRDPSGKVLKRRLRDAHWTGEPSAVSAGWAPLPASQQD
jgi:long-chain acyl-CoA synthetase